MTPEQKLALMFAADAPPARDFAFELDVAERVARRRAIGAVLALTPWAIAAAVVLWALVPLMAAPAVTLSQTLGGALAPGLSILALAGAAGFAGLWLTRRRMVVRR